MEEKIPQADPGSREGSGVPSDGSARDPLTGLPYRAALVAGIRRALEAASGSSRDVLVVVIDLESFTEINQLLGRQRGDVILVTMADRLRRSVREEDSVARIGGDEFGAVCQGTRLRTASIAVRLEEAFSQPISFKDGDLVVGVTIGSAAAESGDTDPELLLARATAAMRERSGSGSWFTGPERVS